MFDKFSINLAFSDKDILNDYYKWLSICFDNDIKFVRIFLCSFGVNALFDKESLKILKNILDKALEKEIEVCLVLNNFTDYNVNTYLDINDKRYSWLNNPYYFKYKKAKNFFKVVDKDYFESLTRVLNVIEEYSNVKYIELMNEIDQIECSNIILINWLNDLILLLKNKYGERFVYSSSISNHRLFEKFRKNINCYVDLHFYSFPYVTAIENIEYINSKGDILYLGEYAKYSDSSYLDSLESKIYFVSGLWGFYFYNLNYPPLHWWWQDLLNDEEYIKIIDVFKDLSAKFGKVRGISKGKTDYRIYDKVSDVNEKQKIKERLLNLLKHPLFIFDEFKNIKKFIGRKFVKQSDVIFRNIILEDKVIYYLECNSNIVFNGNFNGKKSINLLTGVESKCKKNIPKGIYIIF